MNSTSDVAAEQPKRSTGRTIARNTAFALGAQLALKVAGFIFNILVIRHLGDSTYGQYAIVVAWASVFSVLGDMGITVYLTREIAHDRQRASELFWNVVTLRFILAFLASLVTTLGAIANHYSTEMIIGVAVFTSSYFVQALVAPMFSLIEGNERLDVTSIINVITQIIFIVMGSLFLFAGLNFVWLVVAEVIKSPIMFFLGVRAVRRNQLPLPRFTVAARTWWQLLKAGIPFAFIQISITLAFRVDTVLLSNRVEDQMVGWYNSAYNLIFSLMFLSTAFNNAMFLSLTREYATNPDNVRPWYYRSVKVMFFLSLPIAIGVTLLADKIVNLLYTAEYAPAAIALAILIWDMPLLIYTQFCSYMTTSIKRERTAARIYGIEALTNIILNLILIPRFGIVGSAFATVLTELSGACQFYLLFRHTFGAGLGLQRLVKIALAGIVMGIVVYLLRDIHLFLVIIAGGAVYLPLVWFSGSFSWEERAYLIEIASRRLAPLRRRFEAQSSNSA
jgi:O-antigen/teichoic acid export membrane protein